MYERYCKLRDEKGYKDATVARLANIPKSTFTDWKSGRSVPKREKLIRIAECLGVSLDYLMTGTEPTADGWYTNPETTRVAQEVFDDPETRMLFDAARNASPEAIRLAAEMLKTFKKTNPDG